MSWIDSFLEEDYIIKEASGQAKGKAEEIKKRRSENIKMDFSRRDAGGAGVNRKAQQMALIENKATPFHGNNQLVTSRIPANINGYQFNPIRNQYRRSMVTGQLGRPTPGVSNGIGNLRKMDASSSMWDVNSLRGYENRQLGRPTPGVSNGIGDLRRIGYDGSGAGAGAPSKGINPWLIGAGIGALGLGALGPGVEHFLGGEAGPSHEEILQSAQVDRMNQIAQMEAERAAASGGFNNPYMMGAAGLGAAGLGYGMARKR